MSGWDTGDEVEIVKDLKETGLGGSIYLSPEIMGVISTLCKDIKLEWQMMLLGEVRDGDAHVTGYWIPKQEVTAGTVKNLDLINSAVIAEKKIIASIHSHGNMAVFFSSTDEEFTNLSLIDHHVVVNNKLEFVACVKHTFPNKAVAFINARVMTNIMDVDSISGLDNINTSPAPTFPKYTGTPYVSEKNNYTKPRWQKTKHALTEEYEIEDYQLLPDYEEEDEGGLLNDPTTPIQ